MKTNCIPQPIARSLRMRSPGVAAVFLVALLFAASTIAAEITATLEPTDVSLGESAELTVTVSGSRSTAPSLPSVDGLDFQSVGQSTQIQVINGAMTAESTHTYVVTPQRAGTFTIPAIEAGEAKSNPVTLRVDAGAGGAAPLPRRPQAAAPRSSLPPPSVRLQPNAAVTAPTDAQFGFLQLVLPKKEFYVGEAVPVEVKAYFPEGAQASVTGLPVLSSEAFTSNQLEQKPTRAEQMINGRVHTVLTWHSAISAVKAGDYSLSTQMPATVIVRERRRQTSGSLFDDFFDDPFFGRGAEKEVTLRSEPDAMKVLPLPAEGQPPNFSGAVGSFVVEASASPIKVSAGDPITLTLKVSGAGDFDRITFGMPEPAESWKTYKPKSSFELADSAGYQGTKTFEQVIMPNDAAVTAIPALSFSFFNPETRQYITETTEPILLEVTAAPAGARPTTGTSPATSSNPQPAAQAEDLVPNRTDTGQQTSTLRPTFLSRWYTPAQAVPLIALVVILLFIRRRKRLVDDPEYARATVSDGAVRAQLAAMDQAMRREQPLEFFTSARSALQQRLGDRWKVKPESITVADVTARLNGEAEGVRAVFEMADRLRFSPEKFAETDLRRWKNQVVDELNHLKA